MVIKIFAKLGRMNEQSEKFNKEVEIIRKYQVKVTELKHILTALKNVSRCS